jgi:hypothetical protein
MRLNRPDCFAVNEYAQDIIGTVWTLEARNDPDGILEHMLPGDQIEFGEVDLDCTSSESPIRAQRMWELRRGGWKDEQNCTIQVYQLEGD